VARIKIDDLPPAPELPPELEELIQGAGLKSFKPAIESLEGREMYAANLAGALAPGLLAPAKTAALDPAPVQQHLLVNQIQVERVGDASAPPTQQAVHAALDPALDAALWGASSVTSAEQHAGVMQAAASSQETPSQGTATPALVRQPTVPPEDSKPTPGNPNEKVRLSSDGGDSIEERWTRKDDASPWRYSVKVSFLSGSFEGNENDKGEFVTRSSRYLFRDPDKYPIERKVWFRVANPHQHYETKEDMFGHYEEQAKYHSVGGRWSGGKWVPEEGQVLLGRHWWARVTRQLHQSYKSGPFMTTWYVTGHLRQDGKWVEEAIGGGPGLGGVGRKRLDVYDRPDGTLESSTTTYDDGRVGTGKRWVNGTWVETTTGLRDGGKWWNGNEVPARTEYFDARTGELLARDETTSDGVETHGEWEDSGGLLRPDGRRWVETTTGSKDFQKKIETFNEPGGTLEMRETTDNDGRTTRERFIR